jgi:hypothetical protein
MKFKSYIIAIAFILSLGCSKEEEIKIIFPIKIAFVHADGSAILTSECINPNGNYAILIQTNSEGNGVSSKSIKIDYSVNGVLYNMTFVDKGKQLNPIKLVNGLNVAQILNSTYKNEIRCTSQGEFELVQ